MLSFYANQKQRYSRKCENNLLWPGPVHLTYRILLWGNSSQISEFISYEYMGYLLQKNIIRIMNGYHPQTLYKPSFKALSLLTFPSVYIRALIIHLHNSRCSDKTPHKYYIRPSINIFASHCHDYRLDNNPMFLKGVKCYNKYLNILGFKIEGTEEAFKECSTHFEFYSL